MLCLHCLGRVWCFLIPIYVVLIVHCHYVTGQQGVSQPFFLPSSLFGRQAPLPQQFAVRPRLRPAVILPPGDPRQFAPVRPPQPPPPFQPQQPQQFFRPPSPQPPRPPPAPAGVPQPPPAFLRPPPPRPPQQQPTQILTARQSPVQQPPQVLRGPNPAPPPLARPPPPTAPPPPPPPPSPQSRFRAPPAFVPPNNAGNINQRPPPPPVAARAPLTRPSQPSSPQLAPLQFPPGRAPPPRGPPPPAPRAPPPPAPAPVQPSFPNRGALMIRAPPPVVPPAVVSPPPRPQQVAPAAVPPHSPRPQQASPAPAPPPPRPSQSVAPPPRQVVNEQIVRNEVALQQSSHVASGNTQSSRERSNITPPASRPRGAQPPGFVPPSNSIVEELNNSDNFMAVAERLQLRRLVGRRRFFAGRARRHTEFIVKRQTSSLPASAITSERHSNNENLSNVPETTIVKTVPMSGPGPGNLTVQTSHSGRKRRSPEVGKEQNGSGGKSSLMTIRHANNEEDLGQMPVKTISKSVWKMPLTMTLQQHLKIGPKPL